MSFLQYFKNLEDPRTHINKKHQSLLSNASAAVADAIRTHWEVDVTYRKMIVAFVANMQRRTWPRCDVL